MWLITYTNVFPFNLRTVKPTLPDNYQEKTWEKLHKAVVAIQTAKSIEYSLEELYQAVENMCSHKMDSQLYTKLTALTESHVKLNIKTFFSDTNDKLVCFFEQATILIETMQKK